MFRVERLNARLPSIPMLHKSVIVILFAFFIEPTSLGKFYEKSISRRRQSLNFVKKNFCSQKRYKKNPEKSVVHRNDIFFCLGCMIYWFTVKIMCAQIILNNILQLSLKILQYSCQQSKHGVLEINMRTMISRKEQ